MYGSCIIAGFHARFYYLLTNIFLKELIESMYKKTAFYARISKPSRHNITSNSINSQINMLYDTVQTINSSSTRGCIDINSIQIYTDYGYSGRNNKRPAFRKMIAQIMLGEVGTVLVKDFSRFSREHILMSEFLEKIFPEKGVRFISVADNFDNIYNNTSLATSFKSLFNEYYCRDISNKVKSVLSAKKEAGSYSTANVPLGYYIHDTEGIKVHPGEALAVRRIFCLAYRGYNCRQIADILNSQNYFAGRKSTAWDASYIWSVLGNPFYTGMHVWHKYETNPCQPGRPQRLPRDCWNTSKGSHQGIIPEELFNIVNSCHNPSKSSPKGQRHIFHGITKCKNCHKALCSGRRKKEYLCCSHCGSGETRKIKIDTLYKICIKKINEEYYRQYGRVLNQNIFFKNTSGYKELILQNFIKKIEIGDNYDIDIFWNYASGRHKIKGTDI